MTADLRFGRDVTRQCELISINDDDIYEGNEEIYVLLETTEIDVELTPTVGVITIIDDDSVFWFM